jgi:hypothetical protein
VEFFGTEEFAEVKLSTIKPFEAHFGHCANEGTQLSTLSNGALVSSL